MSHSGPNNLSYCRKSNLNVIVILTIAVVIISIVIVQLKFPLHRENDPSHWFPDNLIPVGERTCDITVVYDLESASNAMEKRLPFILKGYSSKWSLIENWKREHLLSLFHNRSVSSGSEGSIVHGGGIAGMSKTFGSILDNMRNPSQLNRTNLFVFDVNILTSIPELATDYEVLPIFTNFDNEQRRNNRSAWHMLSLGPSRSGLPFHFHGQTWLSLAHGAKQWFLYPPGTSPPKLIQNQYSPFMTVMRWYRDLYPILKQYSKPVIGPIVFQSADHPGYRPLECYQQSGDIVYLPSGWSHMTINDGETIGIGGQGILTTNDRYRLATDILNQSPANFDGLKALGVSLIHQVTQDMTYFQRMVKYGNSGLIQLNSGNFDRLVLDGMDSWIVIYTAMSGETREGRFMANLANFISSKLSNRINVGIYDVNTLLSDDVIGSHQLMKYCRRLIDDSDSDGDEDDETETEKIDDYLPCIRIYLGHPHFQCHKSSSNPQSTEIHQQTMKDMSAHGITYPGPMDISKLLLYVIDSIFGKCELTPGSYVSTTVKARLYLERAQDHLMKALEIEPYNIEASCFLGEGLGLMGDINGMKRELKKTEQRLDELLAEYQSSSDVSIPSISIASAYQMIGHTYLTKQLLPEAQLLLNKSFSIASDYSPALVSMAILYNMLGDADSATQILQHLELLEPLNPRIKEIRQMMHQKQTT